MRSLFHQVLCSLTVCSLVFAADLTRNVPNGYYPTSLQSSHIDGRFVQVEQLSIPETQEALVRTVRRFLYAMKEIKVTVWLAHGTLLGWYWGQKLLPWETNIDVHIHYNDLQFLAAYYNMTFYKEGRKHHPIAEYLLDINPNYIERNRAVDPYNVIDARWIDTATGFFVNISALSDVQKDAEKGVQYLLAKDGHKYRKDTVMPLRASTFEKEEVYIPRNVSMILTYEYGNETLVRTTFQDYTFNPGVNQWQATVPVRYYFMWKIENLLIMNDALKKATGWGTT